MGFTNRSAGGSKYLTFKEGKIKYKDSDGVEQFHPGFLGYVIDLDIKDEKFEGRPYRQITLFIVDDESGKMFEMQMALESGYGNSFACIAPNVNWAKPIEVSPTISKPTTPGGNGYGGMYISQEGSEGKMVAVKWKFTKDNPGNRPEVVEKTRKVRGKDVPDGKDFSARNDFYEKVLLEVRESIKKETGGLAEYKPAKAVKPLGEIDITEPIDELPF